MNTNNHTSVGNTISSLVSESNKLQDSITQMIKDYQNVKIEDVIGLYFQVINVTSFTKSLSEGKLLIEKNSDDFKKIEEISKKPIATLKIRFKSFSDEAEKDYKNKIKKPIDFIKLDITKDYDLIPETDVIIINDVLEHLKDEKTAVDSLKALWNKTKKEFVEINFENEFVNALSLDSLIAIYKQASETSKDNPEGNLKKYKMLLKAK